MARIIHWTDDALEIRLTGWSAVAALKRHIIIPYTAVARVSVGPPPLEGLLRLGGTSLGDLQAGHFLHGDEWWFLSYAHPAKVVTLGLRDFFIGRRRYTTVAIEVEDPAAFLAELRRRTSLPVPSVPSSPTASVSTVTASTVPESAGDIATGDAATVSDGWDTSTVARGFYAALPLYALVPVVMWGLCHTFGASLVWPAFAAGMLGWLVALVLRTPVLLAARGLRRETDLLFGAISGPAEEGTRVAVLAILDVWLRSRPLSIAASVGQGWAAVEVGYTVVAGLLTIGWIRRAGRLPDALRATPRMRGKLPNPAWGVVERVSASLYHIGATLLMARSFWLMLLLAPVHSTINLVAMRLIKKRSVPIGELWAAAMGILMFASGLWLLR